MSSDKSDTQSKDSAPGTWYQKLFSYIWYDIILLLPLGCITLFKDITTRPPVIKVEEIGRRNDHVAVITGGPRGIAVGLIKILSRLEYTIIMGVRNIPDSQRRLDELAKLNPDLNFKVKFAQMDLFSLQSVKEFAQVVLEQTPRIDLLLCNAAVMREPYKLTEDGYESQFVANYLSNFLLTSLLLERMKETGKLKGSPCHVIYTSSLAYRYGTLNFEEMEKSIVYTRSKFYYPSKLYGVISIQTFEKKVEDDGGQVHFSCVHPGIIYTDLWRAAFGRVAAWLGILSRRFLRNVENGGNTVLWPAFAKDFADRGGLYFESGKPIQISNTARNKENQSKLYEKSIQLLQKYLT